MCGWNQDRGGGKRYMWRIDTERSVSKSDKSKLSSDFIPMTGRYANGMNTTQFTQKPFNNIFPINHVFLQPLLRK